MTPKGREFHVVPVDDLKEHVPYHSCWCRPICDPDEDHEIFIHNSMDRREHTIELGKLQ